MAVRIDEESANRLINKTEHAPVVGMEHDYVVGLDIFHQLHCLVSSSLPSLMVRRLTRF